MRKLFLIVAILLLIIVPIVSAADPYAGYVPSSVSGEEPLIVNFTDISYNSPTAWVWQYKTVPGSVWITFNTTQNPVQTFMAGNYSIRLNVSNAYGYNITPELVYVTVITSSALPSAASFTGYPLSGAAPLSVTFTDSSTNDPDNWDWYWYPNETKSSDLQNPTVLLPSGLHNIRLWSSNVYGGSWKNRTAYVNVSTGVLAPVADFTLSKTIIIFPGSITVTDTSLNDPTSWLWQWGDGSANTTTQNATHQYRKRGIFNISLTATNGYGSSIKYAKVRTVGYQGISGVPEAPCFTASRELSPQEYARVNCQLCKVCTDLQPHLMGMPMMGKDPTQPDVNTTEKVVYDGATPIKNILDTKLDPAVRSQAVSEEIYKVVKDVKLPYTFKDGKTEIIIKKIELVESNAKVGYWISATRDGQEVHTHSPIWIVNQPTDVQVSESYDSVKNERTTTIKEDPLTAAQQVLSRYVSRQPLGKAEGDDVLVVYLSEDTADEYMRRSTAGTWTAQRNGAGEANGDPTLSSQYFIMRATADQYDRIYRFGYGFNTSGVPDDATVTGVINGLAFFLPGYTLGNYSVGITGFTPTVKNNFQTSDYNKFTDTRYATDILDANIFISTAVGDKFYNNFTWNADGIAAINKTGYTNFMLRHSPDIDNSSPTWISNGVTGFSLADYTESSTVVPFLEITYTPAAGGDTTPPASITGFTNSSVTCVGCTVSWTNPVDADFASVMLYQDDVWHVNETGTSHAFTGLNSWQSYVYSTKTQDATGNINTTWVNQTVSTSPICKIINYIRQFWGLPLEVIK